MTLRRGILTVLAVAVLAFPAGAGAAPVPSRIFAANANDPGIDASRGDNYVWLSPVPSQRIGKLLVFLPSGGATNLPKDWTELGNESARLGYHTIVLAYKNEAPVVAAPPAGCGPGVEAADAPPDCAINVRRELLDGGGESTVVDVTRANSIENRLDKALQYLVANAPAAEGWSQFVDAAGEPKWADTVIAGASLGAGEAVLIAAKHKVSRVALFHGWTDAKHGWVTLGATPSNRYFGLIHQRDAFYARTCFAYVALGMVGACPLPAGQPLAENLQPPFATRLLVFNLEPFSLTGVTDPYHSSTTRDGWIAREADGVTPSQKLVNAWRSVLGASEADGQLDPVYRVATPGGASGTVPATLSLTLGGAASFGTFVPGFEHVYEASTTADVVSTAGDATLSVSDPGHLANGAFALPQALQVLGVPKSYSAPVSHDVVTIGFRQPIGATDALRTGTYTKTLTFTLSTMAP